MNKKTLRETSERMNFNVIDIWCLFFIKMSQIFGPPLCHLDQWLIFYWPKNIFPGQPKADPHFKLKLRKHPNAYIAIKWNQNLLVITFLTTLTPLARVVLRNDASPSDGDNTRLVCVKEWILMLLIKKKINLTTVYILISDVFFS
jgi:hypothetical protein